MMTDNNCTPTKISLITCVVQTNVQAILASSQSISCSNNDNQKLVLVPRKCIHKCPVCLSFYIHAYHLSHMMKINSIIDMGF